MQVRRRVSILSTWLTSVWMWFVLFGPTFLVVILQERALGAGTGWGFAAASTLVQQLAAGIVTLAVALWLRRRAARRGVLARSDGTALSVLAALLICAGIGVARGLGGGLAAEFLANGDPQFLARIVSWVIISVTWMILLSALFATAQRLWESRSEVGMSRGARPLAADASPAVVRRVLTAHVRSELDPAISDVISALERFPNAATLEALGEELGAASGRASALLTEGGPPAAPTSAESAARGRVPAGAVAAGVGVLGLAALGLALIVAFPALEEFLASGWGIRTAMYFALVVGVIAAALVAALRRRAGVSEAPAPEARREVARELEAQLHGPVLGRVSAAAMALSFSAHEQDASPERTDALLATVRAHLTAASADLEELATGRDREASDE